MAGRDLSAELFGEQKPTGGRDLSAELFGAATSPAPSSAKPVMMASMFGVLSPNHGGSVALMRAKISA